MQVERSGFIDTTMVNAGEAELKGLELDLAWRISERFLMTAGYTYADSEYTDFNLSKIANDAGGNLNSTNNIADAGNAEADFTGNQLPQSAKHAATLAFRYEQPIGQSLDGFAELNGSYQSKRYISDGNNAYLGDYDVWDLSLGVNAQQWSAIFYVVNLFDDDTIRSGISNTDYGFDVDGMGGLSNSANLILPQPRTIGLRASYHF